MVNNFSIIHKLFIPLFLVLIMTDYSKAKSKFVKEKIKKTSWKNREMIDDLIFLEDYITGKIKRLGWSGGMKLHEIKSTYKKEYATIYKELDPKGYKKLLDRNKKEKEQEKREDKKFREEEMKELMKERKEWKKAGGKA